MTEAQETLLHQYARAVISAPSSLHLTSDNDQEYFRQRHIQDAVKLSEIIPAQASKLLDLGSGNGVPGMVLAILNPEWHVTLLDSDNKKCGFLDSFRSSIEIKNVRVICGRAETIAQSSKEMYDVVTARAFSKLPVSLELGALFLRIGGDLIVPHGTSWKEEYEASNKAAEFLEIPPFKAISYTLVDKEFAFLIYRKIRATPDGYPRAVGIPAKRPLQ